tara:strand:+ start:111 stop:476 length:366 start_codon:yes stop_codon:yes gene_type:complete
MANPSTEGPSGSGTEVLRRAFHITGNSSPRTLLTVTADHIYTILCVTITNHAGVSQTFDFYVDISGQAEIPWLVKQHTLASHQTFVWNDKFVMVGADTLKVATNTTGELKCYVSFIDQNWE